MEKNYRGLKNNKNSFNISLNFTPFMVRSPDTISLASLRRIKGKKPKKEEVSTHEKWIKEKIISEQKEIGKKKENYVQ